MRVSEPVRRQSLMESLENRICLSDTSTTGIALADVNGDGRKDLIVTRFGHSGGLTVRLGNGDGTFGAASHPAGYTFARGAAVDVGDFNQDGSVDIVVYGGFSGAGGGGSGGLYVLLNGGGGAFATPARIGGTAFNGLSTGSLNDVKLAVADVNGDGHTDIAVSDPHLAFRGRHKAYGPEQYLLLGNGDGTFANGTPIT